MRNILVTINGCQLSQQEEEIIRNELTKKELGNTIDETRDIQLDENMNRNQMAEITRSIAHMQYTNLILAPTIPLSPIMLRLIMCISWLDGYDAGLGAGGLGSDVYILYKNDLIRI